MENLDKDWAYLKKFERENKTLKLQNDETRIVFIGDSIIAGWKQHSFFTEHPNFINRGINGQTTSQIVHRFQSDVIHLKPKCVVILVGTNDIAENNGPMTLEAIQANYLFMVKLARENNIKIVLCSILPVTQYYWNRTIDPVPKIAVLNTFLSSLADSNEVHFLDFYTDFLVNESMCKKHSDDGVHPNIFGYNSMSTVLLTTHPIFFKNKSKM